MLRWKKERKIWNRSVKSTNLNVGDQTRRRTRIKHKLPRLSRKRRGKRKKGKPTKENSRTEPFFSTSSSFKLRFIDLKKSYWFTLSFQKLTVGGFLIGWPACSAEGGEVRAALVYQNSTDRRLDKEYSDKVSRMAKNNEDFLFYCNVVRMLQIKCI